MSRSDWLADHVIPVRERLYSWRFRLFSGQWCQIKAAAVEVDGVDEVLLIAGAAGRVL